MRQIKVLLALAAFVGARRDVRRAGDDQTTSRGAQSVARRQVVGPDVGAVDAPVAVGVDESFDHAARFGVGLFLGLRIRLDAADDAIELACLVQFFDVVLPFQVISVQLTNVEPPMFVPAHARWFMD